MPAITDLSLLLATMTPALHPGRFAFVSLPIGQAIDPALIVASIRETEGLAIILAEQDAIALGLPMAFIAAWITLTVHSDLAAVGLTAAVSNALADAGISCNMVAGVHHDHLFVPVDRAEQAIEVLQALQQSVLRA